jgi:hypothetical protein
MAARPSPGLRRALLIVAVVAFILVDIALITIALSQVRDPVRSSGAYITPTAAPVSPVSTPTPTPTEAQPVQAVTPTRFLSATDDQTAWRAVRGACPTSSLSLESTENAGESWASHDVAATTAASGLLQLEAIDSSQVSLITLRSDDCNAVQNVSTYTAGDAWESYTDDRLSGSWYITPGNRAVVHSPAGDTGAPCEVVVLAPRNSTDAAALCLGQAIFRTVDGGATWDGGFAIPGAANLDDTDTGYVVAATEQESCDGVQLRTVEVNPDPADGTPTGCFASSSAPGDMAIAFGEDSLWVWAGDSLGISSDLGATWE